MGDGVLVKICGIASEADALRAVGVGADALGFVFAPSPRQVTVASAADIVKRLPQSVLTVGVFRNEAPRRVVEIVQQAGLGAAQLHGHETADEARWVRERLRCTIKAFAAGERTIGRFTEFGADYLMIDGPSPGSGQVFDWRLGEGVVDPGRLIVSGGLHPDNVAEAIVHLRPFGVDVSSGVEAAPGRKDPAKLRRFIRNAKEAAARLAPAGSRSETGSWSSFEGGPGADDADGDTDEPYDWMER